MQGLDKTTPWLLSRKVEWLKKSFGYLFFILVCFLVGGALGTGMKLLFFQGIIGVFGLFLLWNYPHYTTVLFIVLVFTIPVIDDAQFITFRGVDFRIDYFVFMVAVAALIGSRGYYNIHTPMDAPMLAFLIVYCLSIVSSFIWGYPPRGPGGIIRLVSCYGWYFVASRLTHRKQIPRLVWCLTLIAALVTATIMVTALLGSRLLYSSLFISAHIEVEESRFYNQFFLGKMTPWIWLRHFDGFVVIPLVTSTVIFLLKGKGRIWCGIVALLIVLRAFAGAQRFVVVYALVGSIMPALYLVRAGNGRNLRVILNWVVFVGVSTAVLLFLTSSFPAWAEKLTWLRIRTSRAPAEFQSISQWGGVYKVWEMLTDRPLTFFTGFGYFVPKIEPLDDINLGPLLAVFYYGFPGLGVLLWMLVKGFRQSWDLLQVPSLSSVEYGLICAILVLIPLGFFQSFIRGLSFVEASDICGPFAILMGWVQVIWFDVNERKLEENRKLGI